MAAKLVAEEGIQKGLILSLDEGSEWVIGRDPDACQLLIEDPSASRKHLLCRKTSDGIFLQNLSSTNPISINDEEVLEPRLLRNGDLVKIGTGAYRFYSEEEAQLLDKGEVSEFSPTNDEEPNGHENPAPQQESLAVDVPSSIAVSPPSEKAVEREPLESNSMPKNEQLPSHEQEQQPFPPEEENRQPSEEEKNPEPIESMKSRKSISKKPRKNRQK